MALWLLPGGTAAPRMALALLPQRRATAAPALIDDTASHQSSLAPPALLPRQARAACRLPLMCARDCPQIRFTRMGRKKLPFYRIVAVDSRVRRDGAPLEYLGW